MKTESKQLVSSGSDTPSCSACGGCFMLEGLKPGDDVMNKPCPQCNENSPHYPAKVFIDVWITGRNFSGSRRKNENGYTTRKRAEKEAQWLRAEGLSRGIKAQLRYRFEPNDQVNPPTAG